jgi:hypothetical protein
MPEQREPEHRSDGLQGPKTRNQERRIAETKEVTKSAGDAVEMGKPLDEARRDIEPPPDIYDMRTGDRSIKHGANQEGDHHKRRVDESQVKGKGKH